MSRSRKGEEEEKGEIEEGEMEEGKQEEIVKSGKEDLRRKKGHANHEE